VAGNRVELWGRLGAEPDLRITPAGTPILKLLVECGVAPEQMRAAVVMSGEQCLEVVRRIHRDRPVRIKGRLRSLGPRLSATGNETIEVIASSIEAYSDD